MHGFPRTLGICSRRLICVVSVLVLGAGCGAKTRPLPLQPPLASSSVGYRLGAPISVATTQPSVPIGTDDALAVRATWVALSLVPKGLRPILSDAALIAAPRSAEPFLAAGQLSRGATIVPAAEVEPFLANVERGQLGQWVTISMGRAALPAGVTVTFALNTAAQGIEVDLHRPIAATTAATTMPSEAIQLSLALDDGSGQRERVLLAPQSMPPPTRFALVLPSNFPDSKVQAVLAIIELAPSSDSPEHVQAVAACVDQLQKSAAGQRPAAPDTVNGWTGIAAALRAMDRPATSRVAMVYLAGETGADLFGDVALVAPDPILAGLSSRIRERLGDPPIPMEPAQFGWQLDVLTLQELAALQSAEKLPEELEGVLSRYAGEAARNAGSLEELTRVQGRDQLRARLIAENFTYLEDASPSARVRAYDWLKSRGRAPEKYDPLGPAKARSAAIDAAMTAAAAAATTTNAADPAPQTNKRGVP